MFNRGHRGSFHKLSLKHLHRYITEFAGRDNIWHWDTLGQLSKLAFLMDGK